MFTLWTWKLANLSPRYCHQQKCRKTKKSNGTANETPCLLSSSIGVCSLHSNMPVSSLSEHVSVDSLFLPPTTPSALLNHSASCDLIWLDHFFRNNQKLTARTDFKFPAKDHAPFVNFAIWEISSLPSLPVQPPITKYDFFSGMKTIA